MTTWYIGVIQDAIHTCKAKGRVRVTGRATYEMEGGHFDAGTRQVSRVLTRMLCPMGTRYKLGNYEVGMSN